MARVYKKIIKCGDSMSKKLHEFFNLKEPVTCQTCNVQISNVNQCKVLIKPEAIRDAPYEAEIDETDVEYICLDCCDRLNI